MASRYNNTITLNAVTAATDGSTISTANYEEITFFNEVSVNTGAVTITIEASPDGSTWYELDAKTYTAVTGKDVYSYNASFPFVRATTTTQSTSTVTVTFVGSSIV